MQLLVGTGLSQTVDSKRTRDGSKPSDSKPSRILGRQFGSLKQASYFGPHWVGRDHSEHRSDRLAAAV